MLASPLNNPFVRYILSPTVVRLGHALEILFEGAGRIASVYLNDSTSQVSRRTDLAFNNESDTEELEELLSQMSI